MAKVFSVRQYTMSKSAKREERQVKVFTKWVNSYLRKKKVEVADLKTCFHDGVNLCYLYEIISEEKLPRYNLNPKGMIQKTNNLAIALKRINSFVKECGIGLQYSPQQVAAGDARQILGMLWILITKFVVPESEESLSRKRSLLRWVQRVTEKYDNVDVKDFTRSWQDGLAFNALLDQFDSTLMDYSKLTKKDAAKNCENAFSIAHDKLDIYRLLDVEDVVNDDIPDEKSVMTYVATLYQYFHSQAGRKLEQEAKQLVVDIGKLLEWLRKAISRFQIPEEWVKEQEPLEKMLEDCWGLEKILHKFGSEKADFANVKARMYLKLAQIQRVQRNERINIFNPPKEQNFGVLHKKWGELNGTIIKYSQGLREEIRRIEELIQKRDEEWIALKEKNAQERRESEKQRLEDLLKIRDDDENERKTAERKARDDFISKCLADAEEKRKQERKIIEDEINQRDEEEDQREHKEREERDADIAEKEKEAAEARELEKKKLEGEIGRREQEESERRTEERKKRDEWIALNEKNDNEKQEIERKMLEEEIKKREIEELERRTEERKVRDEWIKKCEEEAEEKRILEKKRLEDEIKERDVEDSKRREEERRRRELIIKQQEEKAAEELAKRREEQEKLIAEKLNGEGRKLKLMREKADEDSEKMREDENKKRVEGRKKKEEEIAKKREEEARKLKLMREKADEDAEKMREDENSRRVQEREKAEKEISEKLEEEAKKRELMRKKKDEDIEKMQAETKKKNEEEREKVENEVRENIAKEAEELKKKRDAADALKEKKDNEEQERRDNIRKEKEKEIAEKLEKEKKERHEKRDTEISEKKASEEEKKIKLDAYDKESSEFLAWISTNQSELTHVEEVGEDQEDLSTDEEKRNKRKQAAIDVKEKIKPSLELHEKLVESKIESLAGIPKDELVYAMSTFLYALVGEEADNLNKIRTFKFPEGLGEEEEKKE